MLAIVPVNSPGEAKRRLAPFLGPEQRTALVVTMLEDVLAACRGTASIDRTIVVTPEPSLAPAGMAVLPDPGQGDAAAIELALGHAGADGALIVMADCPLVTPAILERLARAARPVAVGLAQDGGTNALALRPADAVAPAFGVPNGAAVVVERARALGFEPAVVDDPALALDVDTLEDLERACELGEGTRMQHFVLTSDLLPDRLT